MAYSSTAKTALTSAKATISAAKAALGSTISAEDLARLDAALDAILVGISEPDPTDTDPPPPPPEPEDPDGDPEGRFRWLLTNTVIGRIRLAAQAVDVAPIHTSAKTGGTWAY